ncbi:MAG TPA: MFS transporter [Actinomycetales bacterium]|nr:MFS transporter [Actinomycetales bacterium]
MTVQRDRLTWSIYSYLALWGWFLYSFGPSVPLIREEQGTSRAVAGLHGTALAVGALLAAALTVPVTRRLGRRGSLLLGSGVVVVGVVLLVSGPWTPWTIAACAVVGTGGSLALNTTSAVLSVHHHEAGPAAISEANGVGAGVGVLAPVALGASIAVGLTWRGSLGLAIPLALLAFALIATSPRHPALLGGPPPAAKDPGRLPLRFWPALGLLMCCVAVEFCTTYWTGDLLHERTGVMPRTGAALVSVVIIGMATGRALASRLTRVASVDRLLAGTIAVAASGWLIMWLATDVQVAAAGLLVTGLGLALQFPLSISRLMSVSGGRLDAATGWASLGAGLASGIAPFALGALADAVGPHTGFLLVPCLLALAAAMLLAPRTRRSRRPVPVL